MEPFVEVDRVTKTFTLHLRGGARLPIMLDASLSAGPGECVVLGGPSGVGKSSLLKMIYGNYRVDTGRIWVRAGAERIDIAKAEPRRILAVRRSVLGYVSQFLRVIPRLGALDIVSAAGRECGLEASTAERRAKELLDELNVPARLWKLPPATFSGGEQQRVNIARGLIADKAILLLDEPTASLDRQNRAVVIGQIERKKASGSALIGIFHDDEVREAVATRVVDVSRFSPSPT